MKRHGPSASPRVETRGYQWLSFGQRFHGQRNPSVPQGQPFLAPGFNPGWDGSQE